MRHGAAPTNAAPAGKTSKRLTKCLAIYKTFLDIELKYNPDRGLCRKLWPWVTR
jgi:hypothetical protein